MTTPDRPVGVPKPATRHVHRPASPAELDAAARIMPADIESARHEWRRIAPRALATLLDAQPERPAPEQAPPERIPPGQTPPRSAG